MDKFKDYKKYTLVILSTKNDEDEIEPTVARILKESKSLGIKAYFFDLNNTNIDGKELVCKEHGGIKIDSDNLLVLARGSVVTRPSWINLVKRLEHMGITCINSSECTQVCSDKYQSFLALSEFDVPQPESSMLMDEFGPDDYKFPLILKTTSGSKGVGVLYVESFKSLNGTVQLL